MGYGQITITQNDMPTPGDTLRYSNVIPQGIDIVQTGANQTWDYSQMVPVSQDRVDYVFSLQTVYAFYFLGLNQYGTKIADTLGGGPFQFTNVYNFYRSTSNDFQAEGVGFRYSGVPLAAYYSDEDELYKFPLDYLDRDSSTYKFSADLGNGLRFAQEGYRINQVDGWGTITTPHETIACLRLVSTTIGVDSIIFNGFPIGVPNQQKTIKFLANGVHIPILEISGRFQQGQFQPQQVKYRDVYQNLVATTAPSASGIRFFPNPTQNYLTIESSLDQALNIEVTDMQGKLIDQKTLDTPSYMLSVKDFAPGMYMMRISDREGQVLENAKIIVGGR